MLPLGASKLGFRRQLESKRPIWSDAIGQQVSNPVNSCKENNPPQEKYLNPAMSGGFKSGGSWFLLKCGNRNNLAKTFCKVTTTSWLKHKSEFRLFPVSKHVCVTVLGTILCTGYHGNYVISTVSLYCSRSTHLFYCWYIADNYNNLCTTSFS